MPTSFVRALRFAAALLTSLVMARAAGAQGVPGVTFEAGYKFLHASQDGFGETFPIGFDVDVLHGLKPLSSGRLDVIGSFGLSFASPGQGEHDRLLTAMGGVRWTRTPAHNGGGVFVEGQAGLGRSSASFSSDSENGVGGDSENAFGFEVGGGYEFPVGRKSPDIARPAFGRPGSPPSATEHMMLFVKVMVGVFFPQSANLKALEVSGGLMFGHK